MRKVLNLTQQEFAERLNIGRGTLANYEVGRNEPIDAVIALICKEFNANEKWLRTGEGEMFIQRSRNDELSAFMDELLAEETPDFRLRLVTALARLKPEQWDALEAVALSLMDGPGPSDGDSKPAPKTKLYIAARDGSRTEVEVDGDFTIPDESDEIP